MVKKILTSEAEIGCFPLSCRLHSNLRCFRSNKVVVFFYCRAKTNIQIANSANIGRHDLARREEAKDQNKNVA